MNEQQQALANELLNAETWAAAFAQNGVIQKLTPIQNYDYNQTKARILIASAQEIGEIWPKIHKTVMEDKIKNRTYPSAEYVILSIISDMIETGPATYYVYTEQSLVTAVSAFETYFKDKLADAIQNEMRLLNQYKDRKINVKRVIEVGLDLKKEIGKLIVEDINFQILDNIKKEYEKAFGVQPFSEQELLRLKQIFAIRHLIVHRSGFVDHLYLSETGLKNELGSRIFFKRIDILDMLNFMENIVRKVDSEIKLKPNSEVK